MQATTHTGFNLSFHDAVQRLQKIVNRTPLMFNANLSKKYQCNIFLKRKDLQVVRSYKIQGAYNIMSSLPVEQLKKGVVCASAGNHAQGFAYSCKKLNVKGVVFMPIITPKQKITQVRMFGEHYVDIKLVGDTFDDCAVAAKIFTEKNDMVFIPPFDDLRIIEGQGTVGGEPEGAPSMFEALKAGHPVELKSIERFVDDAAVKRVRDEMLRFPFVKKCWMICTWPGKTSYPNIESNILYKEVMATGKNVVVIGGGDTGSDCVGTSNRHGAKTVTQFELLPKPPQERDEFMPWPNYPMLLKETSSHEEGANRKWAVATKAFIGDADGNLIALKIVDLEWKIVDGRAPKFIEVKGSERKIPCELALLAMGFVHPQHIGLINELGIEKDARGNVQASDTEFKTNISKIFTAGDMRRGQSLVVWAISEGRECARKVDEFLINGMSTLESKDKSFHLYIG